MSLRAAVRVINRPAPFWANPLINLSTCWTLAVVIVFLAGLWMVSLVCLAAVIAHIIHQAALLSTFLCVGQRTREAKFLSPLDQSGLRQRLRLRTVFYDLQRAGEES